MIDCVVSKMETERKNTEQIAVAEEKSPNMEAESEKKSTKSKKDKKNKKKPNYARNSEQKTTRTILFAIMAVGFCLLAVSVAGLIGVSSELQKQRVVVPETTTVQPNAVDNRNEQNNINTPIQNVPEEQPEAVSSNEAPQDEQDDNGGQTSAAPQSDAEWLTFFNNSVNTLKTGGASFTKAKQTATQDIQLSNKLAQAYVSSVKDKFLSDETVKTDIAKGDTSAAQQNVSPEGTNYVSALSMGDIKSISHTTNGNGNYVVRVDMNDATNPEKSGAYGKIFEFMIVDDVENTYAPDIGATVSRENISLFFSGCYAEAEITPDGTLVSYATYVNAHMILKSAKISVVTTDLDATLASNTTYNNIVW